MKLVRVYFVAALLSVPAAFAQTPPPPRPAAPATPRPAPLVSPAVEQGKVTFRIAAPKAQQANLKINGRKEPVAMQRDEKGVWSATVEGLVPEIYEYQFDIDGLTMLDPANSWVKTGLRPNWSQVEVPATPPEFWETQNVPHGVIAIHTFMSKALGNPRTFRVYVPPDYDQRPEARFPVLYLVHGSGDTDDGWTVVGRANLIADNLLAAGRTKSMLIVMPNGSYPREAGHEADFETDLLQEIVPLVEKQYRVDGGAKNRALAGLSMGGFQTLDVGVKHMDQFAWLGVFSAGIRDNYPETHGPYLDKANEQLGLFWIGVGEDDFLLPTEKKLEELLKARHVKYSAHLSKGGHTWTNWRHYLHDFLPLLFRDAAK